MNKAQRTVLVAGLLVAVAMVVYPPWERTPPSSWPGVALKAEMADQLDLRGWGIYYRPLYSDTYCGLFEIEVQRLFLQLLGAGILTAAGYVITSSWLEKYILERAGVRVEAVEPIQEKAIDAIVKLGGDFRLDENKAVVEVLFPRRPQGLDAGLEQLKGLTNLKILHLNRTEATDAGLVHLKGMTKLKYLGLFSTKVTDSGLAHLEGLTKLEKLDLRATRVTDAGLVHLEGLTKLEELVLYSTKVTAAGVKNLQQALPNCKISH